MAVTETLLSLVKSFEGCKLSAYPDPVSGGEPYTIGFGATGASIGPDTVWTMEQALEDLTNRLESLQTRIKGFLEVELTQNQLDALTSLAYNIGIHALETSFLVKCCNARNWEAAAAQFLRWDKSCGKEIPGLLRRRRAEAELYKLQ